MLDKKKIKEKLEKERDALLEQMKDMGKLNEETGEWETIPEELEFPEADSKRDRKNRAKSKISKAITKYGFENFVFEILEETNSQDELNYLEQKYIKKLKSNIDGIGYNLLSGGHQNGKHSEETKLKISKNSTHHKPWLGKHHSAESNKKRSEALKGVPCPSRTRVFSKEERLKRSENMKKIRSSRFWASRKTITSI